MNYSDHRAIRARVHYQAATTATRRSQPVQRAGERMYPRGDAAACDGRRIGLSCGFSRPLAPMNALVPGPFSVSFHLGRIPVVIQPMFWVMSLLFGMALPRDQMVIWVAVVLVSILVHELGHALAYGAFGAGSAIELYAMGGLCYGDRQVGRWQGVIVSLAGPFAGFLLGGATMLVEALWEYPPEPAGIAIHQLKYVNFFWGLMNLVPVLPLDGGRVLEGVMGPRRQKWLPLIAGVAGGCVAVTAAVYDHAYAALLFGYLAFRNLETWRQHRPKQVPQASAAENDQRVRDGWAALHGGNEREAARLGKLVVDQTRRDAERAAALDLLAWSSLAMGEPTHALSYLRQVTPQNLARPLTWALAFDAAEAPAQALPYARQALEATPSDTTAALAVRLLVAVGDHVEAEKLVAEFPWSTAHAAESARAHLLPTRATG